MPIPDSRGEVATIGGGSPAGSDLLPAATRWIGAAAILLGAGVLVGWAADVGWLKSVLPGWASMKANTAVCFVLVGVSLLGPRRGGVRGAAAAAAVGAIAALTGAEWVTGVDLGIDTALFADAQSAALGNPPGRMAAATALCFLLVGAARLGTILLPRRPRAGQASAVAAGAIAYVAVLGYLYDFSPFRGVWVYGTVAVHTALLFGAVAIALLLIDADRGYVAAVAGPRPGSVLVRRVGPVLLAVPGLAGWAGLALDRAAGGGASFAVAFAGSIDTVVVGAIVVLLARSLNDADAAREMSLRQANQELDERVRDRTAELAATNRELEAFAHAVAHDLRGPLNAISGYTELVAPLLPPADVRARRYLAGIVSGVDRSNRMLRALLGLSRVSRVELRRELVDVSEVAHEVATQLQVAEPDRRVELVIPPHLTVRADPDLVRIALENLLGNAWKYTSRRDRATIEIGTELREGSPAVFVRDDGAGFDPSKASRIFEAFTRLHDSSEFPGTGLGLATVARIARRHGGRVGAEGSPGAGARFWLTFG